MNNNGVIYYKLEERYDGDITKYCGLTGGEIDSNMFFLRGYDISNVEWDDEDKTLKFNRINGETISVSGISNDIIIEDTYYDPQNGTLYLTINGKVHEISGFYVKEEHEGLVYTDASINGTGTMNNPLSVNDNLRSGFFTSVDKLIDLTIDGSEMPTSVVYGDRVITKEEKDNFGLLVNFNGVKRINEILKNTASEWRVPTNEDWGSMLNAIESENMYRNHQETYGYRGKIAGAVLKKGGYKWLLVSTKEESQVNKGSIQPLYNELPYPSHKQYVQTTNEGVLYEIISNTDGVTVYKQYKCVHIWEEYGDGVILPDDVKVDYKFNVLPLGTATDSSYDYYRYFGKYSSFWSSSTISESSALSRSFYYDKNNVYIGNESVKTYLSVRLVRDYDGTYNEMEYINGKPYHTILMSHVDVDEQGVIVKKGYKVWTVENISFNELLEEHVNNRPLGILARDNEGNTSKSIVYNLNFWNGAEWVKQTLKTNDIVVICDGPDGSKNEEWKIVEDKIVRNSEGTINSIKKYVDESVKWENERAVKKENEISNTISNFKNESTINFNTLETKCNTNSSNIEVLNNNTTELSSQVAKNTITNIVSTKNNIVSTIERDEEGTTLHINTLLSDSCEFLKDTDNGLSDNGIKVYVANIKNELIDDINDADELVKEYASNLNDELKTRITVLENIDFDAYKDADEEIRKQISTSENSAKKYADSLAVNYDAAGTAGNVLIESKEYTDDEIEKLSNSIQKSINETKSELNNTIEESFITIENNYKSDIANEIAKIVNGADKDFDTLKEVADWIKNDNSGAAALQNTVSQNQSNINTINTTVNEITNNITQISVDLEKKVDVSEITEINNNINVIQESIKEIEYKGGDGILIVDREVSVDNVKLNKTQLNDDIRVAGGPLSIISDNWPEDWYLNDEPIIPKTKSMYDILTALFLKVVKGKVSWGEISWNPKLSKPTIKLTESGTVEVGTKIEINSITSGDASDLNRSAICTCTEGYFDTVDGAWNGNNEKKITKTGSCTGIPTFTCKWINGNIEENVSGESGTELTVKDGKNELKVVQFGQTASVDRLDTTTVYASTNTKVVIPEISATLTDEKPNNKSLSSENTVSITGSRYMFWGANEEVLELNSENIRGLKNGGKAFVGAISNENITTLNSGVKQFVVAIPKSSGYKLTSILNVTASNDESISSFSQTEVSVNGANDYNAVDYTVYFLNQKEAWGEGQPDGTTAFRITIEKK